MSDIARDIRKALDIPQSAMADMLGIHPMTLSRIERGVTMPPSRVAQYLRWLKFAMVEIVERPEEYEEVVADIDFLLERGAYSHLLIILCGIAVRANIQTMKETEG